MKKVVKETKSNNKEAHKTLGLAIIFAIAFFILGTFVGFYFGGKVEANTDNNKCDAPVEELPA